jgi:hypothetical protein
MRWARHVVLGGEKRMTYSVLVWKPVRKGPLESTRNRCEGMDWIDLVQDRDKWLVVVNTVLNMWVP